MKRRNALLTTIAAFLLLTALFVGYRWAFNESALTVHLRCGADISGNLSIVKIAQNGAFDKEKSFTLAEACRAGKIETGDYRREESVQVTLERGNGEKHRIALKYGQDIQSDQNGFYVLVKILENPPFLIKDNI